jgi:hypothetical protein
MKIYRFPSNGPGHSAIRNSMRHIFMRNYLFIASTALLLGITNLHAQEKVFYVEPKDTDPATRKVHSAHVAVYNPAVTPRHELLLLIPGTRAVASNTLAVDRVFARWGYHAITLDYENDLLAVTYANSTDPTAFERYRDAIVTGAPVCDGVKVDAANSILNRTAKLLVYLDKEDPKGGWDQYVKDGKPVWNRIIAAGHSQGAGHVAYIGKKYETDAVFMFSGPQDYMEGPKKAAPWEAEKSATSPSRFFAFLSAHDPYNSEHQIASCVSLMQLSDAKTNSVKPGITVDGDSQILVNDISGGGAHGSTISVQFTNVWQYMLAKKPKADN